jgi:hypothetical protein
VYLPRAPAKSRLAGQGSGLGILLLPLMGTLFGGIGARFFVRALRHARLEWRLRREGTRADAIVTDISATNLTINRIRQFRLLYEYRDHQSARHTGTIDLGEDEATLWKVGDVGAVLYDPRRPAAVVWTGTPSEARTRE